VVFVINTQHTIAYTVRFHTDGTSVQEEEWREGKYIIPWRVTDGDPLQPDVLPVAIQGYTRPLDPIVSSIFNHQQTYGRRWGKGQHSFTSALRCQYPEIP